MKSYWLSWYARPKDGPYTLHWPWWISGARISLKCDKTGEIEDIDEETPTICAAVQAESEEAAKDIIFASYERRPEQIEWRFCEEQPTGWAPFCGRFERADWMQWPTRDTSQRLH